MEVWGLKEVSIVYLGLHGGLGVEGSKKYAYALVCMEVCGLKEVSIIFLVLHGGLG